MLHQLRQFLRVVPFALSTFAFVLYSLEAHGDVERYKSEAEYQTRLQELGLYSIHEGFESSAWDNVRSNYPLINSLPSVTNLGITWEAAGLDLWSYPTTKIHGVTTNNNWSRSGNWGIFENHLGDPIPTTIRVSSPTPIYGLGGWFDTNPDGQSVGFLFENRTVANDPGYLLPGLGAMYPGDSPSFGHTFIGFIDPAGFNDVILTGTLEINEEGMLEGGTIYGADDFSIAFPLTADFDGDGDADSFDLTNPISGWEVRFGVDLDGKNFLDWQRQFSAGITPTSLALAIPEPSNMCLALTMAVLMLAIRVRQ